MDWFERLVGFRECGYEETRSRLLVDGGWLSSRVNGARYRTGTLELVSLQDLRARARDGGAPPGRLRVSLARGDVRRLHQAPEYAGALFQVASQFNLLEMVSYEVTPEDGVTGYQDDHTQGPACAIAAGAATIYRNYFAPVGGGLGQTAIRQIDGLGDLGAALSAAVGRPVESLWTMRNGYALCSRPGLETISAHLARLTPAEIDALRAALCIGLHSDVEVTDAPGPDRPLVSQAFCSALPVAYTNVPAAYWEPFARLVLEAAYEATLWAAVLNARRGASSAVLLTLLGGGAFGNRGNWIEAAIRRAFNMMSAQDLDVRIVSYGPPSKEISALV